MKKYTLKFLTVLVIANLIGCENSQRNSNESGKIDTTANQTLTNKTDMIKQKITPCLWVETKDAKAVADYYLSIFKGGNLKEHRKYKNPPEAGGGDLKQPLSKLQIWN